MRYNDQAVQPPKKQEKEKPARELTKPGQHNGDTLRNSRNIPWLR